MAGRTGRSRAGVAMLVGVTALAALAAMAPIVSRPYRAQLRETLRAEVARTLAERIPRATLVGDVRLDARLRLVVGPIVIAARRAGAPPVVRVERISARPRLSALVRGRLEASDVAIAGLHVEPGAGLAEAAALLEELSSRVAPDRGSVQGAAPAAPLPTIAYDGVTVSIARAVGSPLTLGPFAGALTVARGSDGAPAPAWRIRLPGGGTIEGAARLGRGGDDALEAPFTMHAKGVWLEASRIAAEPVGPIGFRLSGLARWQRASRRIAVEEGRLSLGAGPGSTIAVTAALDVRAGELDATVRAQALDWAATVAALPPALRPPPEAPAIVGVVRGALDVAGPLRRAGAWRVAGELDLSGLAPAVAAGGPRLDRPFTYRAALRDGEVRRVVVGPANPAFVPVADLPRHVVRAVTASEDAGFFGHHGFDLQEIREALSRADGRARLRGASTISQQLAKNLYLSPERTLARKVREALATVALETCVSKRRLLEIYLNVAEWGDGVVGIGEAARHWFGKDARALTPKEAAFLASVIPNPVRYELYRRRGALTPLWEDRVRELLLKLRTADVLSDDELHDAWEAPLAFAPG